MEHDRFGSTFSHDKHGRLNNELERDSVSRQKASRFSLAAEVDLAMMNVSLPESMKTWVESQAQTGSYCNASDYVRDLIRRDQERAARLDELQALITQGIESGVSARSIGDVLDVARRRTADTAPDHAV